jgi:zinc transporter 9
MFSVACPEQAQAVMSHLRKDPVVAYVTDTKTEEIGPGVFRFKVRV